MRTLLDFRWYIFLAKRRAIIVHLFFVIILRTFYFTIYIMLLVFHDCFSESRILNRLRINISLLEGRILGGLPELFRFLFLLMYVWLDWWVDGVGHPRGITFFLFCLWAAWYHNTRYKVLLLLRRLSLFAFLYCHRLIVRKLLSILALSHLANLFDLFFLDNLDCEIRCLSLLTCGQLREGLLLQQHVRERINFVSNLLLLLIVLQFLSSERVLRYRCQRTQLLLHVSVPSLTLRLWRYHTMFKGNDPIGTWLRPWVANIDELVLRDQTLIFMEPLEYLLFVWLLFDDNLFAHHLLHHPQLIDLL